MFWGQGRALFFFQVISWERERETELGRRASQAAFFFAKFCCSMHKGGGGGGDVVGAGQGGFILSNQSYM